jgi:translocation and assembly module TamB
LRTAQTKATQALGSKVQFKDFAFGWSGFGPNVALYNLVVDGAAPYLDPPLLTADSLSVQVTISSAWHRSWYVNDLQIKHPVVHIFADNQGNSNLPHPPNQKPRSGGGVDVFALGVRRLLLGQGEVYYNDQKGNLTADLHELEFQLGFALLQKQYSGTISYRDGHVQWQGGNPLPHQLDARFSATPKQFTLQSAVLRTGGSHISLQATAQNYSQPKVRATYEAVVNGGEFQRVLKNQSVPTGMVHLSGVADYQQQQGKELLASTTVRGELHSAELAISQQRRTLTVRDVGAQYSLANGDARVTRLHAELLGGMLEASMTMRDLTGATRSNLEASLRDVSASAIQQMLGPVSTERAVMRGAINATANAAWGKTFRNLLANAEVNLATHMQPAKGGNSTPVNGLVHAQYDAANETLALRQSHIRTPQTTVSLEGTVSKRSSLQVAVNASQLHELEQLADAFRQSQSPLLGLYGSANITATVTGSTRSPQVTGRVTGNNLRVRETAWKLMQAQFAASASSVRVDRGELVPVSKGHVAFQMTSALNQWAFTDSSQFQARLTVSDLSAEELAKAAGVTTQVSGTLSANVDAQGTQLAPMGQGKIQLSNASIAEQPVKEINLGFQGDGNTVNAKLQADLKAGTTTADVQFEPKQRAYEANLKAIGIKLDELETVKARNLQLSGELNVTASGRGTLQDPGMQATIEVPRLGIRNQTINDLKLIASVANHVATFDLASEVLNTHAGGHGTIQLTGDYPTNITFDTQALPLQPVFAMYAPAQAANLTGQTELHATVRGPLKNKSQLNAHLEIPTLNLNYKNTIQLAAAAPIRADYTSGTLDVKRSIIRGTGTELTFQANVPTAKDAALSMLLQGTIDLQLAELFDPDITSGGQLRFDIDSYGQRSDPNIQGQVRIVNASFAQAGVPLGLRDGNGMLTLTRNRLNITEFQGKAGGGTVTASGGVVYRPELRFDIAMKANGARVLYAQSIRTTLGSNLTLTGQYDGALLRGQVTIDQLSFTSNFDLMDMASQFGGGATTPPPPEGFSQNLRLDVAILTPGGINPSSRNLSMAGTADLQLRGTASQPVMLGRINLSDGELIFRGNRYLVQGGTIEFRDPIRTKPVMDMSVNTTIDQYNIQMHFWGPADHLHTNYSSDPALPPADIINLIAFGKTSEASAANPSPAGSLGAESLVASQVSSQVTSRIEKFAGLSQLSVDPALGGSQQNRSVRIAIQQHVTSKIFVTYASDATSTQQQTIKLEYQITPRASVNAVRDQNGGFSFETNFRKQW